MSTLHDAMSGWTGRPYGADDPVPTSPQEWHRYVTSAPNSAAAMDRIQEAAFAGVDLAELNALPREAAEEVTP